MATLDAVNIKLFLLGVTGCAVHAALPPLGTTIVVFALACFLIRFAILYSLGGARTYFTELHPPLSRDDIIVITGGNKGIGLSTAKEFARLGASVIIACRSKQRAAAAVEDIRQYAHIDKDDVRISYEILDLSSLQSVRDFALQISTKTLKSKKIRCLINNAGIAISKQDKTDDGFAPVFQVNYLGHFLLVRLLLRYEMFGDNSRIANVASCLHVLGKLDFTQVNTNSHVPGKSYTDSKALQILFSNELSRRLKASGSPVITLSLNPGIVYTDFIDQFVPSWIHFLSRPFVYYFLSDAPDAGAQTSLMAALSPSLNDSSGAYLDDCAIAQPAPIARNTEDNLGAMKYLWDMSSEMLDLDPDEPLAKGR